MDLNQHKKKLYIGISLLFCTAGIIIYENQKGPLKDEWINTYKVNNINQKENVFKPPLITVHIAGAVKKPGVYKVPAGLRTLDILKYANGLLSDANIDKINLAKTIKDGNQVFIPHYKKSKNKKKLINQNEKNKNETIININQANEDQLQLLPGVGANRARKIITYRKKIGSFKNINDLTKIKGIGKKTIQKWQEQQLLTF